MEITLTQKIAQEGSLLLVLNSSVVSEHEILKQIDVDGSIARVIELQKFKAKMGEVLHINMHPKYENIWLVGASECNNFVKLGSNVTRILLGREINLLSIYIQDEDNIPSILSGIYLRDYVYDVYKSESQKQHVLQIQSVHLISSKLSKDDIEKLHFEAETVKKTRSLINCPPCDLYPEVMANYLVEWLQPLGVNVKILKGKDLDGMGMLLGVGKASTREAHVVVMEWNGSGEEDTVAFVGKGVTYDSGGLSIKPSNYMESMKSDMSGSAIVGAVLANAARNKINKRVIGIVGLVENMIAGNALRPDDVLKSLAGITVEVNNTDAEGRLVLGDILEYVQTNYSPSVVIDLATLTGAIVVALGHVYSGLFSNDDELANSLISVGNEQNEEFWRMPLHKAFDDALESKIADIINCAPGSVGAGSSTAAMFLKRFIKPEVKWAHLDIAGVSFLHGENFASTVGATGFGVRTLNAWLEQHSKPKA